MRLIANGLSPTPTVNFVNSSTGSSSSGQALQTLTLAQCDLDDTAVGVLCIALRPCRRLASLDLGGNRIGSTGFESLAVLLNVSGCSLNAPYVKLTDFSQAWATANDTTFWEQTLRAGPSHEVPPRPRGKCAKFFVISFF